jgi:hypothetical protein
MLLGMKAAQQACITCRLLSTVKSGHRIVWTGPRAVLFGFFVTGTGAIYWSDSHTLLKLGLKSNDMENVSPRLINAFTQADFEAELGLLNRTEFGHILSSRLAIKDQQEIDRWI